MLHGVSQLVTKLIKIHIKYMRVQDSKLGINWIQWTFSVIISVYPSKYCRLPLT